MGNEESTVVDKSKRPSVLEARNIDAVAKYIKEHDVKRIVVMVCGHGLLRDEQTANLVTGGRGNQYIGRHPGLSVSRHGTLRQSSLSGPRRA